MDKKYIGDAVYVSYDGYGLTLTTKDGYRSTNTIYLEPEVFAALTKYVADLEAEARRIANGTEALPD